MYQGNYVPEGIQRFPEFSDFYREIQGMDAIALYERAEDVFLAFALSIGNTPTSTLEDRVRGESEDLHEKAHQYANAPASAIGLVDNSNYSVSEHVLMNPEISLPVLYEIFQGINELGIPQESLIN